MPSASSVGAADALLDQVLNFRSDLAPETLRALRRLADTEPREGLERLREDDPDGYAAITLAIAAGYYMSPVVCELIGYSGPRRASLEVDLDDLARLLDPVIRRGPVWRRPPA